MFVDYLNDNFLKRKCPEATISETKPTVNTGIFYPCRVKLCVISTLKEMFWKCMTCVRAVAAISRNKKLFQPRHFELEGGGFISEKIKKFTGTKKRGTDF